MPNPKLWIVDDVAAAAVNVNFAPLNPFRMRRRGDFEGFGALRVMDEVGERCRLQRIWRVALVTHLPFARLDIFCGAGQQRKFDASVVTAALPARAAPPPGPRRPSPPPRAPPPPPPPPLAARCCSAPGRAAAAEGLPNHRARATAGRGVDRSDREARVWHRSTPQNS